MRRTNSVISVVILLLLLAHMIWGSLILSGIANGGNRFFSILSMIMLALVIWHLIIGLRLTLETFNSLKMSGVSYTRENRLFWLRRISGFAIIVFIICHLLIFVRADNGGMVRLNFFGAAELISQLLLIASVAVHVLSNIKPLFIGLGMRGFKEIFTDALFILSIMLLIAGIAFIFYFIRWQVF